MDYAEAINIVLLVIVTLITRVFSWRTAFAYFSLSLLLAISNPLTNMPERLLLYTAISFAAYLAYGIAKHRIESAINKKNSSAVPRGEVKLSLSTLLAVFSIGYLSSVIGGGPYISFLFTLVLFFGTGLYGYKNSWIWKIVFLLALLHSAIFFGGKNILNPLYFVVLYVITIRLFFEAKDAFSFACIPAELKPGMIPAETIVWNGKEYVFGNYPFPSLFGLLRYLTIDKLQRKIVVASFFIPLKKENIAEVRRIAKTHKRKIILVQKRIDFLPFLILGAIMVYLIG